ncbi:OprO/OprP family phosphate-selective porin [Novosphingobium mangrovi (ex Huang et al. 2023)]|uniref:Porin n=1 Tax=Novosphingobium mangrovi (ex Huang et al. 2023) TaxID=2976432 RepID=A0ABT2I637_9SPHN|nr:porin [Novosphingobium mangrovi (ex Huang et al. 2023)]MCT2400280.1 porin [Novosphingobium mangrovi (ex Huang et al. 2023)]
MRTEIRALRERLERLESALGMASAPPPPSTAAAPANAGVTPSPMAASTAVTAPAAPKAATKIDWKGSPRLSEGDKAFKVKGRIQADANYISAPGGLDDNGLGFSSEMRRIRLGGEGSLGAGFGYKLELELSDNAVDLVDSFVTYKNGSWLVTLGNHNPFQALDELTGDTSGSFMERAAFTDAFGFERRLGLSAQYQRGDLLAQLGIFTDDIGSLANSSDGVSGGDENNSYSIDGRLVFAPKADDIQLHFGASAHQRRLGRLSDGTTRYRQRPYAHSTSTRLIGTPTMQVDHETSYGLELAGIAGRWHGAVEVHALRADRAGLPSVTFRGGYAEVGYFLTRGDSRGYKSGIFTSKAPATPLGDGGIGSIQVNLRYDYLDLDSKDIRGGTQNGYIAALIWSPIQYLRFNFNYALLQYDGARVLPSGRYEYDAHVVGTRFELDF